MCGIIGYSGPRPVVDVLLKGLKRLEYRGYDSAGVAFFEGDRIQIKKSEGKIVNVESLFETTPQTPSHCGIGHTRWATHGKPTTQNAHPHRTGSIVLVHNGIIENYLEIKASLAERGLEPTSETDSELFGFLINDEMAQGKRFVDAVRESFLKLQGSNSVVVMNENEPGTVVGIRNGSPLVAAVDPEGGYLLASDAQPLIEYSKDVYFLDHGQMTVGTEQSLKFFRLSDGQPIEVSSTTLDWSADDMDKQGYPHFMLKEIFEQPQALVDTLNGIVDRKKAEPFALADQPGVELLARAKRIVIVACGTSYYAALMGKYWIERWGRVPVEVELASEFRYRDPVLMDGTVVVGVTQSGETADTLAVITEMKSQKIPTIALTNCRGSTIDREADATFYTSAGPEIGVLATKSFTTQLMVLMLWAGYLGIRHKTPQAKELPEIFEELLRVPHSLENALQLDGPLFQQIENVSREIEPSKGFFFIGRGYSYPMALEGALKLKEVAYVHAEGYAGGELKHGPLAMIDEDMVLVTIAPNDVWLEKTVANLQEVKARKAKILGVGNPENEKLKSLCDFWIPLPVEGLVGMNQNQERHFDPGLYAFLIAPVVQLVGYHMALLKGTNVDQPRNLAKSVTVE